MRRTTYHTNATPQRLTPAQARNLTAQEAIRYSDDAEEIKTYLLEVIEERDAALTVACRFAKALYSVEDKADSAEDDAETEDDAHAAYTALADLIAHLRATAETACDDTPPQWASVEPAEFPYNLFVSPTTRGR